MNKEVLEEEYAAWLLNKSDHPQPVWGFLIFKSTRGLEKLFWDTMTATHCMSISENGKVATHTGDASHGCVYATVGWKTGIHR